MYERWEQRLNEEIEYAARIPRSIYSDYHALALYIAIGIARRAGW